MKKSTEERLADIEGGITRLTKMQGCVFNVLLTLDKISMLIRRAERSTSSLEESVEFTSQAMDDSFRFMFGTITTLGITISITALYLVTKDFLLIVLIIICFALTGSFFFLSVRYNRRAKSQRKTFFRREWPQAREQSRSDKEEAAALDDVLAQVLAEWKELSPDDLVSESKNDTSGLKDSHDKS